MYRPFLRQGNKLKKDEMLKFIFSAQLKILSLSCRRMPARLRRETSVFVLLNNVQNDEVCDATGDAIKFKCPAHKKISFTIHLTLSVTQPSDADDTK